MVINFEWIKKHLKIVDSAKKNNELNYQRSTPARLVSGIVNLIIRP